MLVGQLAAQEQEPFEDRLSRERRRKGMITKLSLVTILVRDQEEALRWFTEILGLKKHGVSIPVSANPVNTASDSNAVIASRSNATLPNSPAWFQQLPCGSAGIAE
jgi:hypothetical protein